MRKLNPSLFLIFLIVKKVAPWKIRRKNLEERNSHPLTKINPLKRGR
jgi:hypothetical protein